jgi:hypothetical protein
VSSTPLPSVPHIGQPNRLPGTSTLGSYLYIVEFNTGTIKVGRTRCPETRLKNHATAARPHGITVARQWVSQPHWLARDNEDKLIKFCARRYRALNDGEFFSDATPEDVIAAAERLPASLRPAERLRFTQYGRLAGRGGTWPEADPVVVVSLSRETLSAIDAARGSVSREEWVRTSVTRCIESQRQNP